MPSMREHALRAAVAKTFEAWRAFKRNPSQRRDQQEGLEKLAHVHNYLIDQIKEEMERSNAHGN